MTAIGRAIRYGNRLKLRRIISTERRTGLGHEAGATMVLSLGPFAEANDDLPTETKSSRSMLLEKYPYVLLRIHESCS